MIRAVVKHSYIKAGKIGSGRAKAHADYLQYRSGDDRGRGPREFFTGDRESVQGREVKQAIDDQERGGALVHKVLLSPGIQGVDLGRYTKETMESLGREKGQEFEWYAVQHMNTDHDHVHVIVMGHDVDGGKVWFDKEDHKLMRALGDRYLEREHQLERYLDKEIERLLKEPQREHDLEYKRGHGDKDYERWMYGDGRDKKERGNAERDWREWEKFDKDLHKAFTPERSAGRSLTYKQFQRESAGRLLDFHEGYQGREAKQRWEELAKQDPELAKEAEKELAWLEDLAKEQGMERYADVDLDYLMDGKEPLQRAIDKEMELIKSDPFDRERSGPDEKQQRQTLDDLLGQPQEQERELEKEPELGDAWQTFEIDQQSKSQEDRGEDRDDRDDPEHTFGR
jgi:type IV secretory pathway VirD2 relaxase